MTDVIVIGGGPSGMSCALNLLRAGRSVLLLEKEAVGGQIATSPRVENLPSIKEISGVDFSDQLFQQILDLGADFELEEVLSVEKKDNNFLVKTNYGEHEGRAIVIANGVTHRKMNLPKEEEFIGKGISFCAVCDGAFYKGKETYLIGDANSALQYALMLSKTSSKVHMLTLFDKFFGDKILVDRVLADPNIEVTHNMNLIEYQGDTELTGLKFENTKDKTIHEFKTDNVFIAIGQIPHNEIFKDIKQEKGFIITNEQMETNIPGIFAIGDTRNKIVRQVLTAVGDASTASFFVNRYLG